jgi:hypothetical protein
MIRSMEQSTLLTGRWYKSMLAGNSAFVPPAYELIETTILGSATSEVVFSSLATYASTYKHLQLRAVTRSTVGGNARIRFNGDTGANYSWHLVYGTGNAVATSLGTNSSEMLATAQTPSAANQFTAHVIDILDFASTSKNKTIRSIGGSPATSEVVFFSGAWRNLAQITSVTMRLSSSSFAAGSRFSLYGIRG